MTGLEDANERLRQIYVAAQLAHRTSAFEALLGPRRKGHYVESPKDPKFLSAREAWVERWKRITEEGHAMGYLEYEHCYECGGESVPTTDVVDRTWVYDETEEEFEARKPKLDPSDKVTFKIRQRDE